MDKRHLIEPENLGLWVATTFIIALLALVIGLSNLFHNATSTALIQMQILETNKQVATLHKTTKP